MCTDCHGDHDLYPASHPESSINKQKLAATCGKCHDEVSEEYLSSIHGRALALGITDSPSCTDCHDEHLILASDDPCSTANPAAQAGKTCGQCHEDPEMAARYGLAPDVIGSYLDSYHGWALKRDCETVATCKDCHNAHDIRSPLDPASSTHPENVTFTCGQCHENSNPEFAQSYSHVTARDQMLAHDWVRVIYIGLIVLTLGGMGAHNLLIYGRELRAHYKAYHGQPTVVRMTKSEIWQHLALALTFTVLALTGFALRFPESWWPRLLEFLGLTEELRRLLHRVMAVGMVLASVYHVFYMVATARGRMLLGAIFPRPSDAKEALHNVLYYLGLRKEAPRFRYYDYTQKAEYWALVWGTIVMSVTGAVLWWPDLVTAFLPAWTVRVAETIHFWEAVLAVGAIVVWHIFFTVIVPREYPMSWIWISGRMTKEQAEHHHPRRGEDLGEHDEAPADDTSIEGPGEFGGKDIGPIEP